MDLDEQTQNPNVWIFALPTGAYGAEHKNADTSKFIDSEEEEEKEFRKGLAQWKKGMIFNIYIYN